MREKRIKKLILKHNWDLCGAAVSFVVIAALILVLLVLLAHFDVISDVVETWESATTFVLGIPGALFVLQRLYQVGRERQPLFPRTHPSWAIVVMPSAAMRRQTSHPLLSRARARQVLTGPDQGRWRSLQVLGCLVEYIVWR